VWQKMNTWNVCFANFLSVLNAFSLCGRPLVIAQEKLKAKYIFKDVHR